VIPIPSSSSHLI
jgi:Ino eighty subunit 1